MTGIVCTMIGATFGTAAVATITRAKKGIVAIGNAQIDTAQYKFGAGSGGSSILFDGTGDYLIVGNTVDNDLALTSTTWTVEYWARINAHAGAYQATVAIWDDVGSTGSVYYFTTNMYNGTQKMGFAYYKADNTDSGALSFGSALATGVWKHHAFVRNGNTLTAYLDGVSQGTHDMTGVTIDITGYNSSSNTSLKMTIGAMTGGGGAFNGWLDEIRISKTARYTANFTPTTTPFVNDDNTVLLIHGSGTDASTFFEDDNGVRRSTGLVGTGSAALSTTQAKFGNTSLRMVAANNTKIAIENHCLNEVGTGPFTIEFWTRVDSLTQSNKVFLFTNEGEALRRGIHITNQTLRYSISGTDFITTGNVITSTTTWYHVAVVRSGTTTTIYVDGTSRGSYASDSYDLGASAASTIANLATGYTPDGYLDEFRISKVARYTAAFTPPTAPFVNDSDTVLLIHFDGTNGQTVFRDDNGATATTALGTAVEFDGVNDYYSATSLSTTATDSGKLLVAGTIYWTSSTNLQHVVNLRLGTGAADYGFWVWINGGRMQCKMVSGTGSNPTSIYETTENSLTSGAWNNFVIYWDTASYTTNTKIFVNGISRAVSNEGATANNWNWGNTATTIKIGEANSSQTGDGADFTGKIGQLYIHNPATFPGLEYFYQGGIRDLGIKGTATGLEQPLIYHYGDTSTFTTNNGTGFNSYTLTANGNVATSTTVPTYTYPRICSPVIGIANAQIDTAQSKIGGSSLLLDGTGDYIITNPIVWHHASTGTIEFYFRLNSTAPFAHGLFAQTTEGTTKGFQMLIVSNLLYFYKSPTTGAEVYSTTLTTGVWYHIAVVKESSSTVKIYVDGTLRYTDTSSSGLTDSAANLWFGRGMGIASGLWDGTRYDLNGWMDEIRVSKTARYTANFTAPTTPFTNDSNTILLCHFDGTDASTVFLDDNGIADHT